MQVCLRSGAEPLLLLQWVSACGAHLQLLSSQVLLDYLFLDPVAVQERVMGRVRLLSHLLGDPCTVLPSSQAIHVSCYSPKVLSGLSCPLSALLRFCLPSPGWSK